VLDTLLGPLDDDPNRVDPPDPPPVAFAPAYSAAFRLSSTGRGPAVLDAARARCAARARRAIARAASAPDGPDDPVPGAGPLAAIIAEWERAARGARAAAAVLAHPERAAASAAATGGMGSGGRESMGIEACLAAAWAREAEALAEGADGPGGAFGAGAAAAAGGLRLVPPTPAAPSASTAPTAPADDAGGPRRLDLARAAVAMWRRCGEGCLSRFVTAPMAEAARRRGAEGAAIVAGGDQGGAGASLAADPVGREEGATTAGVTRVALSPLGRAAVAAWARGDAAPDVEAACDVHAAAACAPGGAAAGRVAGLAVASVRAHARETAWATEIGLDAAAAAVLAASARAGWVVDVNVGPAAVAGGPGDSQPLRVGRPPIADRDVRAAADRDDTDAGNVADANLALVAAADGAPLPLVLAASPEGGLCSLLAAAAAAPAGPRTRGVWDSLRCVSAALAATREGRVAANQGWEAAAWAVTRAAAATPRPVATAPALGGEPVPPWWEADRCAWAGGSEERTRGGGHGDGDVAMAGNGHSDDGNDDDEDNYDDDDDGPAAPSADAIAAAEAAAWLVGAAAAAAPPVALAADASASPGAATAAAEAAARDRVAAVHRGAGAALCGSLPPIGAPLAAAASAQLASVAALTRHLGGLGGRESASEAAILADGLALSRTAAGMALAAVWSLDSIDDAADVADGPTAPAASRRRSRRAALAAADAVADAVAAETRNPQPAVHRPFDIEAGVEIRGPDRGSPSGPVVASAVGPPPPAPTPLLDRALRLVPLVPSVARAAFERRLRLRAASALLSPLHPGDIDTTNPAPDGVFDPDGPSAALGAGPGAAVRAADGYVRAARVMEGEWGSDLSRRLGSVAVEGAAAGAKGGGLEPGAAGGGATAVLTRDAWPAPPGPPTRGGWCPVCHGGGGDAAAAGGSGDGGPARRAARPRSARSPPSSSAAVTDDHPCGVGAAASGGGGGIGGGGGGGGHVPPSRPAGPWGDTAVAALDLPTAWFRSEASRRETQDGAPSARGGAGDGAGGRASGALAFAWATSLGQSVVEARPGGGPGVAFRCSTRQAVALAAVAEALSALPPSREADGAPWHALRDGPLGRSLGAAAAGPTVASLCFPPGALASFPEGGPLVLLPPQGGAAGPGAWGGRGGAVAAAGGGGWRVAANPRFEAVGARPREAVGGSVKGEGGGPRGAAPVASAAPPPHLPEWWAATAVTTPPRVGILSPAPPPGGGRSSPSAPLSLPVPMRLPAARSVAAWGGGGWHLGTDGRARPGPGRAREGRPGGAGGYRAGTGASPDSGGSSRAGVKREGSGAPGGRDRRSLTGAGAARAAAPGGGAAGTPALAETPHLRPLLEAAVCRVMKRRREATLEALTAEVRAELGRAPRPGTAAWARSLPDSRVAACADSLRQRDFLRESEGGGGWIYEP